MLGRVTSSAVCAFYVVVVFCFILYEAYAAHQYSHNAYQHTTSIDVLGSPYLFSETRS